MAIEEVQKNYYADAYSKWIDIHQSVKCCIEKFLAEVVFKGDYSRVVFAQPDASFRRRIETLDKGKTGDELKVESFSPVSLDLPFATYSQTSDWVEDDRGSTQNTSQSVFGIYDMNIYRRIRSLACKATYKAQLYFSRRDDVRTAAQLLYWEQSPKHPVWMYASFNWEGKLIAIPAFLTIESVSTEPEWQELKFLESQRVFPVEVEFTVRSYQVVIPGVKNVVKLPYRFQNYDINDDDSIYITEQTLLEFVTEKWDDIDTDVSKVDLKDEELNEMAAKYFSSDKYTENELKTLGKTLLNNTTADIIRGYFSETTEVDLDRFIYSESDSTPFEAVIKYKIKKADQKYFAKIVFVVPGQEPIEISTPEQTELKITGLYPSSTYDCKILTYSKSGNVSTFTLSFTTKADPDNQAPTPDKINKKTPGLVGWHI